MAQIVVRGSTAQDSTSGGVDTLTFADPCAGFRVFNRGTFDLWVRTDGQDPIVKGDGSYLVAPNEVRTFLDPGTARELRLTAGLNVCAYTIEQVR